VPDLVSIPSDYCSIVIVARNEERTLPRLLHQLRRFTQGGGDVLVVDTGSTDRTAEWSRAMGARVECVGDRFRHHVSAATLQQALARWDADNGIAARQAPNHYFHFADARNYAHAQAKRDSTWSLDASDLIVACDIPSLQSALVSAPDPVRAEIETATPLRHTVAHLVCSYGGARTSPEPLYQQRYCSSTDTDSGSLLQIERWFDRRVRVYEGRVHEVPRLRREATMLPVRVPVPAHVLAIEHHQNPDSTRSSYLTGLALDARDRTLHARSLFYLGRELSTRAATRATAEQVLKAHLALPAPGPELGNPFGDLERGQTCLRLADMRLREEDTNATLTKKEVANKRDDAARYLMRSILEYPTQRMAWILLADVASQRGQTLLARQCLAAASVVQKGESAAAEPEWMYGHAFAERVRRLSSKQ
jgi:hypothetical protein